MLRIGRRLKGFSGFHKAIGGNPTVSVELAKAEILWQFTISLLAWCMNCYLVMTVLGCDQPGLVSSLADTVSAHGGNWLESRMARLAGQFAGIARIECPAERVDALIRELQAPGDSGLTVIAVREDAVEPAARRTIAVNVVGNDRPGIVRELSAAVAQAGGNIEELTTGLESAPMSGHPMFRAHGIISIPEDTETDVLIAAIEHLGGDLTVDFSV
jgi:glycine cleavage system regulatory protein